MTIKSKLLFEKFVNFGVYVLTLVIETAILYRFYFMYGDYFISGDCITQVSIIFIANTFIFISLYKATTVDCGKLSPSNL